MANSYVQVQPDSTGKKLQTHQNVVGANTVEAEAVVPVHTDGTPLTAAAGVNVVVASGTVTAVTDITNDVSIDDGGNTITVDGTLTGITNDVSIDDGGNTITVDGTVSANATVVAALPAGANAIGKLAANSGVDIGDVDVTSVIPGVAATNLGKAEDAAHSTGDTGVMLLGVRNDTPTSRVNVDGDYTPVAVDEYGRVRVIVDNPSYPISSSAWKYADINDALSPNNTIIAAQGAGNKIAVWSVMVVSDGTVDIRFEDGAAGTAFTGQIPLQAREGFTYNSGGFVPLWVGTANTLLNLELSAAINVHGHVSYTVVT